MIDCANAERARDFYANITGWEKTRAFGCLALSAYNGLTILFVENGYSVYSAGLARGIEQTTKANAL
jgi:hypothetical protein